MKDILKELIFMANLMILRCVPDGDEYEKDKIIKKLLPPLPTGASEEKKADYEKSYEKMMSRLENGDLDDLSIEIEVSENALESNPNLHSQIAAPRHP